jgi:WD40 repeat protein
MRPGLARRWVLNRAAWLGLGTLAVVMLRAVIGLVLGGGPAPRSGRAEPERSPAQLSRDDYGSQVWALAFCPDGSMVASATIEGDVWLKDLSTGRSCRIANGPTGWARSLAFSPDGRVLAVAGSEGSIRLWGVDEGRGLDPLEAAGDTVKTVAFSPAGRLLAVGEWDTGDRGALALWDWGDRRLDRALPGHCGGINVLAFSSDGKLLASGDTRGFVKLWEVASGRELACFPVGQRRVPVTAMTLSPDGTLLATGQLYEAEVWLWDAPGGRPRRTLPEVAIAVRALAFSPDGGLLALARQDRTVDLWDGNGGRQLCTFGAATAETLAVAFSADGRHLATGGRDGCLRLWDVAQVLGSQGPAGR